MFPDVFFITQKDNSHDTVLDCNHSLYLNPRAEYRYGATVCANTAATNTHPFKDIKKTSDKSNVCMLLKKG